jgi:DNA topoisomerase II
MAVLREEDEKLANKVRFIQMVIDGKLVLSKKKKAALLQELKQLKFKPFPPRAKKSTPVTAVPEGKNDTWLPYSL